MSNQIITQPFNGEIGVDDAHQHTDEKQQNKNLDSIVKKKLTAIPSEVSALSPKMS